LRKGKSKKEELEAAAESFGRQTPRDFRQLPGLLVGVVDAGG